jgi:D-3-phosphoglycerate dehydrogenase / 2-oxoglutarate reductase
LVAHELGINVRVMQGATDPNIEPSFSFEATGETSHHVRVSWDRLHAGIVEVDRFALDRALAGEVLITHHRDVPGVIGRVGTILGLHGVNIAGMQVGRHHQGGEALMVVNVDNEIPDYVLGELKAITAMRNAYRVSLPPAPARTSAAPVTVASGAFK